MSVACAGVAIGRPVITCVNSSGASGGSFTDSLPEFVLASVSENASLAGGHSPCKDRFGVVFNSLVNVRLVEGFWMVIAALKCGHHNCLMGFCGSGGVLFRILTSFCMATVAVESYDRDVVFWFNWKLQFFDKSWRSGWVTGR